MADTTPGLADLLNLLSSSNPIGASGMVRFGEAAQQVRGMAGDYQVDLRTGKALGHAYGGGSQFFSMWVVGSGKPD